MINDYRTIVFSSLQKLFPVTLLYAWLQIIQLLFIQPNSFLVKLCPFTTLNFFLAGNVIEPLSLFLSPFLYYHCLFYSFCYKSIP